MEFNFRMAEVGVIVNKINNKYYLEEAGYPSKDVGMTKKELYHVLYKLLGTSHEEIAFMLLDFKENPTATIAHFGVHGSFLFVK